MAIMRIGRAELRVMNLEESVKYYTNVLGLQETGRKDNRIYLKAWDEYDHHSIVLQEADSPGLDHLAFKVEREDDLEIFERRIEQFGCTTKRISNSNRLGEGEALRFELPTGHQVELYNQIERVGKALPNVNPDPWPDGLKGIAPHRLDHCLLTGEDLETVTRFFTEALDFKQSEKITTVDGEQMIGSFLFCNNGKAHELAFVKGPDKMLHHAGFYVDNWYEVLKASDILTKNNVPVELTPTRHGITRGLTTYFYDPSGNRIEAFASGYHTYPDFETITWTEDQIAKGIFYHRREMVESFMKALT